MQFASWDDLKNRLKPRDRRCFAFFHPQLNDEPLVFVEVALTKTIPATIGPLLSTDRISRSRRCEHRGFLFNIKYTKGTNRG